MKHLYICFFFFLSACVLSRLHFVSAFLDTRMLPHMLVPWHSFGFSTLNIHLWSRREFLAQSSSGPSSNSESLEWYLLFLAVPVLQPLFFFCFFNLDFAFRLPICHLTVWLQSEMSWLTKLARKPSSRWKNSLGWNPVLTGIYTAAKAFTEICFLPGLSNWSSIHICHPTSSPWQIKLLQNSSKFY